MQTIFSHFIEMLFRCSQQFINLPHYPVHGISQILWQPVQFERFLHLIQFSLGKLVKSSDCEEESQIHQRWRRATRRVIKKDNSDEYVNFTVGSDYSP